MQIEALLDGLAFAGKNPLTYVAFLFVVAAWVLRLYFLRIERHVRSLGKLPKKDRLNGLQMLVLGFPETLTPELLKALKWRYQLVALIATLFFVLMISGLAAYTLITSAPDIPFSSNRVYDERISKAAYKFLDSSDLDVRREIGQLPEKTSTINVWEQLFDKGHIIYDPANGAAYVLFYDGMVFTETDRVFEYIRHGGDYEKINWPIVQPLLDEVPSNEKDEYERLLYSKRLYGGIGTIYFKLQLLRQLGEPKYRETSAHKTIYAETESTIIYSGLSNSPIPLDEQIPYIPRINKPATAIVIIHKNGPSAGKWDKVTVNLDDIGYQWVSLL